MTTEALNKGKGSDRPGDEKEMRQGQHVRHSTTPDNVDHLFDGEVFVFGSNLQGKHLGGAAKVAVSRYGAVMGQCSGLQGQSYAIPTMNVSLETVRKYVEEFVSFAKVHSDLRFYVTKIGCGNAGFSVKDIAPLFADAYGMENVILPEAFCKEIKSNVRRNKNGSEAAVTISYGQVRTLVDILIGLNQRYKYSNTADAIEAVSDFIASQKPGHESISALAFQIVADTLAQPEAFEKGRLNGGLFKEAFGRTHYDEVWKEAMLKHIFAKLWKLISLFNEFRRYKSPDEIKRDLGLLRLDDYLSVGAMHDEDFNYPFAVFERTISGNWNKFAPNGSLDTERVERYMLKNHENSIRAIGLAKTIKRDYYQHSCHTEMFFPKETGTAPIYVMKKVGKECRFVKACSGLRGKSLYPDCVEMEYAYRLLLEDDAYDVWGAKSRGGEFKVSYFVPKIDETLPIYSTVEKLTFDNYDLRQSFLKERLMGLYVASQGMIKKLISAYDAKNIW